MGLWDAWCVCWHSCVSLPAQRAVVATAGSAVFWPHLFSRLRYEPAYGLTRDLADILTAANMSREKWDGLCSHLSTTTLCCRTARVALSDAVGAAPASLAPVSGAAALGHALSTSTSSSPPSRCRLAAVSLRQACVVASALLVSPPCLLHAR